MAEDHSRTWLRDQASTADFSRSSISGWKVSGVQIATQFSRCGVRKQ
jgi:hypothetical protein